MDIEGKLNATPRRGESGRRRSRVPVWVLAALFVIGACGAAAPSALAAPSGAIAGTATDATTHEPIEGLEVCAFAMNESSEEEPEGTYGCAKTASHGEYTIHGLQSGTFAVVFGWNFSVFALAVGEPLPFNPLNYVLQIYNNKLQPSEATPVTVSAGGSTTGIDAELQEGSEISGTITNAANGTPVQNAVACLIKAGAPLPELPVCVLSGANGQYTIKGVPDGEFDVSFSALNLAAQYYPGKASQAEASAVTISAAKEVKTGIDAAMQPGPPVPVTGVGQESLPGSTGPILPGGPLTGQLRSSNTAVLLRSARIDVQHDALALVRLACAATAACHGKLILTFKRSIHRRGKTLEQTVPLGSVRYSLRHGSKATVEIRLDATARALLRTARGSLAVRLAIAQSTPTPAGASIKRVLLIGQRPAPAKR